VRGWQLKQRQLNERDIGKRFQSERSSGFPISIISDRNGRRIEFRASTTPAMNETLRDLNHNLIHCLQSRDKTVGQ